MRKSWRDESEMQLITA